MTEHDRSYKQIFSHASVIEYMLSGFIHEDWATQIDYGTLEKANGSYIAEDLRERLDDVVWRVKFNDQWLYVYLLIEFQSRVYAWMGLRMLVYVCLLYQDRT
jgi:predicted transposase YdaD